MAVQPLVHGPQQPADMLLRDVHVLDPRTSIDARRDVRVRDGQIAEIGAPGTLEYRPEEELVEGLGNHLLPAFFDPHVHLRTPGQEHKEDLDTGTRAAAAGGYAAVLSMPNTDPVLDEAPLLRSVRDTAAREARINVGFLPAITRGLQGEQLTEMAELRADGAVGFSDDGRPVHSAGMLRKALQYQRLCGGVIALHEEDPTLSRDGCMHEGAVSAALGLAGIPTVAESTMVARDAELAGYEDARVHFLHLSCIGSVEAVADAQARGWRVSAEVSPHHLLLTEEHVRGMDTRMKMHPPLATEADRQALDRRTAQRHDRVRRDRPRAACARGEGSSLRAGADGHNRAGDRVRRSVYGARRARHHRPRPARAADDRRRRAVRPAVPRASSPARPPTSRSSTSMRTGSPASAAGRAAPRTAASPDSGCAAACS